MIGNGYSISCYDFKTLKVELLSINIIKPLHEVKIDYLESHPSQVSRFKHSKL